MTDDRLERVLREHAEVAEVPNDLARSARKHAIRRRGATAAAVAVVLAAGVAGAAGVLGRTHHDAPRPSEGPHPTAVEVCSGDVSGPSPSRDQLTGTHQVVVCRTWSSEHSGPPGTPQAPRIPAARTLPASAATGLLRALGNGKTGATCADTGGFVQATDSIVIDPGPSQRVVTVEGICTPYHLGDESVLNTHGLRQNLDRLMSTATPMPQTARQVCDSLPPREDRSVAQVDVRGNVVATVCRFVQPGPSRARTATTVDPADAVRLGRLLVQAPPLEGSCGRGDITTYAVVLIAGLLGQVRYVDLPFCTAHPGPAAHALVDLLGQLVRGS